MSQSRLDLLISPFDVPDLAVAINRNNTEIFSAGYGHADPDCRQLISADTLFGVASITKLITAIAMLLLQDRGQLSLHDSVSRYYPTLKAAANPDLKLHHLLSHTSGWPGMGSRFHAMNLSAPNDLSGGIGSGISSRQRNASDSSHKHLEPLHNADDLVAFMNHQKIILLAEPGQLLSYCNEGFCLLGGIVEQVTGCSWQQIIEREVFKPLHMSNSTIGMPDSGRFPSIARPITLNGVLRSAAGIWDAPLFYPAGGVVASARDLLRLMTVLSADGPLLEPASRAQLLAPAITVASRTNPEFGYSLGLEYRQFDSGAMMHWHTGQRAGMSALVAMLPDCGSADTGQLKNGLTTDGLSIALLSNSSDAPLTAIAHRLIAELIDGCDPHWPPSAYQTDPPTTSLNPGGHYGSEEGFSYRVTRRDETFYLCRGAETIGQALHFCSATSGYVDQQTFAFLTDNNLKSDASEPAKTKPATSKSATSKQTRPWALALDLRVLPRID